MINLLLGAQDIFLKNKRGKISVLRYTFFKKSLYLFIMTFQDIIVEVEKFHTAFGVENNYSPTLLNEHESVLRYKLMREENEEYLEACENNDLVEVADALGDQLYILCGTLLKHGMQDKIEEVFREIQRSNMSKLDENGKPIINDGKIDPTRPVGKVLKGAQYSAPDIAPILQK